MAGKPVYCGDTDQDKAMGPAGRKLGTKCYVSMPIRSKGVTVGVINVNSLAKNAFDDEELKLLEIVARQIEIAINNASQAQAIRESEKRFRNMADSAPIMIWMSDVEKLCTYVNKGWEQFTGRTIEQDLGDGWVQSVHADDLSLCRDTYISAFDARKEYEMVYRLRRYDGQYRWILEKGVPRFLSNGSFVGYIGSCVDITDRKEAEERLSISARQLKHLSHRLMNVQEIERRHLASELHDEIGQVLTAVKIDLQSIHGLNKDRSHATRLKESISVVDRALKQVRDLSLNLRPSMLDDLGLVATLRWYVSQQAKLGRFTATFAANPSTLRFTPTLEVICFRVVQEALTNILRHARAKKVSVVLNLVDSGVELVIRDDGVGFDLLAAQERMTRGLSFGLLGMQERIELAGGKIEIRSEPKKGTEVRTVFPLSSGF